MRRLKPYLFSLVSICAAFVLFAAIALLPIPGWSGAALRYGFGFWVAGLAILLFFSYKSTRRWTAVPLLLFCCALSLSGLWRNASNELQVLSGFVFFSDAAQYYSDALRLLAGFPISAFSSHHPLATLFLGTSLWLVNGNLQVALLILAFIVCLCICAAADSLARVAGPLAAALLATGLFLFYRRFTGLPNSEQLGLALGCLSLVFLLQAAEGSAWKGLFGLLFLGLGLAARPGAFLIVVPALIWVTKEVPIFPKKEFASLCLGLVAVVLGATLTFLCNSWLAQKGAVAFSNYSFSLYGIARGNLGWEQFTVDHPEALDLPTAQAEAMAFREAILAFQVNPGRGFRGWLDAFLEYFWIGPVSLFGFISGGEVASLGMPESASLQSTYVVIRLLLVALTIVGMWILWHERVQPVNSILFWAGAAALLGLSLIPARDAGMMRIQAVSLPYLLCLPSVGLTSVFQKNDSSVDQEGSWQELPDLSAACLLLILALSFPLFALFARKVNFSGYGSSCQANQESVVVRMDRGGYLRIIDAIGPDTATSLSVQYPVFLDRVHTFYRTDLLADLAQIPPNTALMTFVDLRTGESAWLIMPFTEDLLSGSIVDVCGKWHPGLLAKGLGFLQAEHFHTIASK
ncbi:MAG TPA: hypothetical protein VK249_34235 [Anaerolineales bacterium]|nr:hypothetical protein [Anaerolineales bacterium]